VAAPVLDVPQKDISADLNMNPILVLLILTAVAAAQDVVVIGGTPGGIAAAVTAARLGHDVVLAEYHTHLGAMSSSGLGKSDIQNQAMIQGFFREFVDRVKAHYQGNAAEANSCRGGYYYEPAVAEKVFESFLAEQPRIKVLKQHQFQKAKTKGGRMVGAVVKDRSTGETRTLRGKIFVDATYEGDVYASAGAAFRLGRESRDEFNEPHAGHIYLDWRNITNGIPGGTGVGDKRVPAYTYRLCLTTDPGNSVALTVPPPNYDRTCYLGYLDDSTSGRFGTQMPARIAFSIAEIPNHKTDVNMNPRGLGFVFVGENNGYVEGTWDERERIATRIRNLTLGLLWFMQNDSAVPEASRVFMKKYHLPKDEFTDNGHFPFQLYVREARRLVGEYTLSERNVTEQPGLRSERFHEDAIAVGEFPVDSFPVQKRRPGDDVVLEGYLGMLGKITRPYQIPYRIMIPQKLNGLIVPVAASTTHVAYSSIRLEPTWMVMGQAAGVAAHLAIQTSLELRKVPIPALQALLRQQGAVLDAN
jgi:hypothetical protein